MSIKQNLLQKCSLVEEIQDSVASNIYGGVSLYTRWDHTKLPQKSCIGEASKALLQTGLNKNLSFSGQSVFGFTTDGYLGTVRCIDSKDIAFFAVAGPSGSRSSALVNSLDTNFQEA